MPALPAPSRIDPAVILTFLDQDPEDNRGLERGFVVHRVNAHVGGTLVGYLKISYVPSELISEVFPTLWHWTTSQGWCYNPDDLKSAWFRAHWYMETVPKSLKGTVPFYLHLSEKMYPGEEIANSDLKALERVSPPHRPYRSVRAWFRDWQKTIIDRPWVDYIHVEPEWRRKGIGTVLYEAGARWMAETRGFPLWASSLQTPEAAKTWEKMRITLPVREGDRGDGKVIPFIDYRKPRCSKKP